MMNKESISLKIEQNFKDAGGQIKELRVQPDPFTGWWIVICSPDFEGKSRKERKEMALAGLEDIKIEWLELLTPGEREYAGNLPIDMPIGTDSLDLPLWPEALARGSLEPGKEPFRLLSDMDEDIEPPVIVTFYSLRGGVGRSTAMAYTAYILASQGRKVICMDMDLEAPGITALFGKENEITEDMGLVHLLMAIDQGETPDITKHLLRISESFDLYCLPAGKTGPNYARLLRFIDPGSWYRLERNPLRELFDQLSKNLPFKPDVILLDARTGITPISGPLLFDLSDISIIVFFPHPQAKTGTEALVKALMAARTRRKMNGHSFPPEIRFLVSPIPSSKAPEVVQRYEQRAINWISDWIAPLKDHAALNSGSEILESDITHFVSYREVIATSDQVLPEEEIWRDYRQVAEWIEGFLEVPVEKEIFVGSTADKLQVLENFSFSTGTAEQQEDFWDSFVETEPVKKALSPGWPLVIGRKGTGKTAIFRRLSEHKEGNVFTITCPAKLSDRHRLFLGVEGFKEVEKMIGVFHDDWRNLWTLYICLIAYFSLIESKKNVPLLKEDSSTALLKVKPGSELDIIKLIEKLMGIPRCGLKANDWLFQLDEFTAADTLMLFDGLDTGFGQTAGDRKRRETALEGLFTFMIDSGSRLKHLKFKILLREDIWKSLKFENKSHLFGRSLNLKWNDRLDFFKVIIKQANRNEFYKDILKNYNIPHTQPVEYWGDQQIIIAWNLLVGERMKGGKTAFTRNWAWKRLADGNDDHSPRYLLQLVHQAVLWEKGEHKRNPYERSIIRPRALEKVLPEVSEQALGALRDEEFPELKSLMNLLAQVGRTPVNSSELIDSQDDIKLAMDAGLLGIYEGNEEKVERYKVPEIYRYALDVTRKGQK